MAQLNFPWRATNVCRRVIEQHLLLGRTHQAEQSARLRVVVGVFAMIPMVRRAFQSQWRLSKVRLLLPFAVAVWLIAQGATKVTVHAHGAITMVTIHRTTWGVNRNQVMVHTKTVTLGIAVREQPALQHFIR